MSAPSSFGSDLTARVQQYLEERRRLGFKLCSPGHALRNFARFVTDASHAGSLTVDLMAQWARQVQPRYLVDGQADGDTAARRLAALRPFMRWLQQFEPATEVPDDSSFGPIPGRVTPHIYREAEIVALLEAARQLGPSDGLRAATYATLFGLIASAGLRISEALGLSDLDVDLDAGVLTVRQTKFGKSRLVPLHPSAVGPLAAYRALRRQYVRPTPRTTFFVGSRGVRLGEPLGDRQAHRMFVQLREQLGWIDRGGHGQPRVHDLRHNSETGIIPSSASEDVKPSEETVWSDDNDARNYQRPFRKSMTRSLGLKRGIGTFLAFVLASARSFICMSACR